MDRDMGRPPGGRVTRGGPGTQLGLGMQMELELGLAVELRRRVVSPLLRL